jgi:hypothetical protein
LLRLSLHLSLRLSPRLRQRRECVSLRFTLPLQSGGLTALGRQQTPPLLLLKRLLLLLPPFQALFLTL